MSTTFKKKTKADTSTPPAPKAATGNLDREPTHVEADEGAVPEEVTIALQYKVPESVFTAVSRMACERFGYKKGAKTQMFLDMWRVYQEHEKSTA